MRRRRDIERVAVKATDFRGAEAWNLEQLRALSLDERQMIARILRKRVYGESSPDVRDCEARDER